MAISFSRFVETKKCPCLAIFGHFWSFWGVIIFAQWPVVRRMSEKLLVISGTLPVMPGNGLWGLATSCHVPGITDHVPDIKKNLDDWTIFIYNGRFSCKRWKIFAKPVRFSNFVHIFIKIWTRSIDESTLVVQSILQVSVRQKGRVCAL